MNIAISVNNTKLFKKWDIFCYYDAQLVAGFTVKALLDRSLEPARRCTRLTAGIRIYTFIEAKWDISDLHIYWSQMRHFGFTHLLKRNETFRIYTFIEAKWDVSDLHI
jgi:hypothetical protein